MAALFSSSGGKTAAPAGFPQTSGSYVAAAYQPPAPAPLAAVVAPLPSVRDAEKDLKRKEMLAEKERAYEEKKQAQASKGGLLGKLGKVAVTAVSVADAGVQKGYDAGKDGFMGKVDEKSLLRFRQLGFPFEEKLQADYHCDVVVGNRFATGYISVSSWYLTFDGKIDKLYTENQEHLPVRLVLPLQSIAAMRVGVSKKAIEKGQPHAITLNEDPSVPCNPVEAGGKVPFYDALLVYTADGFLHQFYGFKHFQINFFDDMYNTLDHQWRAAFAQRQ